MRSSVSVAVAEAPADFLLDRGDQRLGFGGVSALRGDPEVDLAQMRQGSRPSSAPPGTG